MHPHILKVNDIYTRNIIERTNSKIIIRGYPVNNNTLVNKKIEFLEQLRREISSIGRSREIIVLSGLNGRT